MLSPEERERAYWNGFDAHIRVHPDRAGKASLAGWDAVCREQDKATRKATLEEVADELEKTVMLRSFAGSPEEMAYRDAYLEIAKVIRARAEGE